MEALRLVKLKALQAFLNIAHEDIATAKSLYLYFFGENMGCSCKYNKVRSQLNQLWESQLKKELENYER